MEGKQSKLARHNPHTPHSPTQDNAACKDHCTLLRHFGVEASWTDWSLVARSDEGGELQVGGMNFKAACDCNLVFTGSGQFCDITLQHHSLLRAYMLKHRPNCLSRLMRD